MEITEKRLIERVRALLRLLTPQYECDFEYIEGVSPDKYITEMLPVALHKLLLTADVSIAPIVIATDTLTAVGNSDGSGYIDLPADAVRPVALRMRGWTNVVTDFIADDNVIYRAQQNIYMRAGIVNPVCACRTVGNGALRIEYYSLLPDSEHEIAELTYVAEPIMKDGKYTLHPKFIDEWCAATADEVASLKTV